MWYPCNCSNCNEEETLTFYPSKESWIDDTNMPHIIPSFHGFNSFQNEQQQQYFAQNSMKNSLQRSATIGMIPNSTPSKLLQIEAPTDTLPLDKKVPSRMKSTSDSVDEYSPENDSIEDGKQLKNEIMSAWIESVENADGMAKHNANSRKNKYTDTVLKPDSSLPPVIRRRNQNRRKQLAASMVDSAPSTNNTWDKQPPVNNQKLRSQSVSDEQWNQMFAIQGTPPHHGYQGSTATSEVGGVSHPRRGYNTMGGTRTLGRGMVSSASVCDLNSLAQQQQQHQHQQHQHPQQQPHHGYPNMHSANSFQQLSLMSYDPNMMWVQPQPCNLCQPTHMYPPSIGSGGMKRTASNLSMNLSSVGSDITGYPYPPNPHVHHHMPMGYPGYYPGCHQHMAPPGYNQGSAMSIPDSMRSYNRMPSSPAPSARSSSHRSHKSTSKSRSFSGTDARGRRSRNHSRKRSEESDESISSSISDEEHLPMPSSKPNKPGGLAWQCDHCTFINPGHVQSCGMCSKIPGKSSGRTSRRGNEHRKGDKRRDRKTDSVDNVNDISDYDNDQRKDTRRDTRLKPSGSVKSSSGKSRKKSKRKESSPSRSSSASGSGAEEEGVKLERQLRDLRLSSRSRQGEYDGHSVTSRTRDKDRDKGSLKKEGKHGYKRRV